MTDPKMGGVGGPGDVKKVGGQVPAAEAKQVAKDEPEVSAFGTGEEVKLSGQGLKPPSGYARSAAELEADSKRLQGAMEEQRDLQARIAAASTPEAIAREVTPSFLFQMDEAGQVGSLLTSKGVVRVQAFGPGNLPKNPAGLYTGLMGP